MSRILASVSMAMLVLTVAMGLKTATSNGDSSFISAHGVAPAPTQSSFNGPDQTPAPWKHVRRNGPDQTPAPWK
jgi:hypothetical protein